MMKSGILILILLVALISCAKTENEPFFNSKQSVINLIEILEQKFTTDAGYMFLSINYDTIKGNNIHVQVTKGVHEKKCEEWNYEKGVWEQTHDITLEVEEGFQPSDFMFSLNDIPIDSIAEIVSKVEEIVINQKGFKEVICSQVQFLIPNTRKSENKTDDISQTVTINPLKSEESFIYNFDSIGNIVEIFD